MYSGRSAFSEAAPVYLLGLNPAGDPLAMAGDNHCVFVDMLGLTEDEFAAAVSAGAIEEPAS